MRTTGGVRAARRRALVLVGATLVALGVVVPPGAAAPAGPDPATAAGPAEDPWAGLDFGVLDVDLDLGILSDPQAAIDAEQLAESLHHQYRRVDAPAAEQAFADYDAVRSAVSRANPQLSIEQLRAHPRCSRPQPRWSRPTSAGWPATTSG